MIAEQASGVSTFTDMVDRAGLAREVSIATGVPYSTVRDERDCGRLKGFLPEGRKQGWLFKPEWVDEWIEGGTR